VQPVLLNNHVRIEAFLFLYFLALITEALIERDLRARMRKLDIKNMPLYREERPCAAPTTERLFELFADSHRHRLVDDAGSVDTASTTSSTTRNSLFCASSTSHPSNISPPPGSWLPPEGSS